MRSRACTVYIALLLCTTAHVAHSHDEPWDFVPEFIGPVVDLHPISWETPCFTAVNGSFHITSGSSEGGGVLTFDTAGKKSDLCSDIYLIATPYSVKVHYVFGFEDHSQVEWKKWSGYNEYIWVAENGVQVFRFENNTLELLGDIIDTAELFYGILDSTTKDNVKFLRERANQTLAPRSPSYTPMKESDVLSGDVLLVLKLNKEAGGSDCLIAWGTNATIGHAALTLWMDGTLWVVESRGSKIHDADELGIVQTEYNQWLSDNSDMDALISLVRLSDSYRDLFNESAAIAFFESVKGNPYGFNNFLFGWIDTVDSNFPSPLSPELGMIGYSIFDHIDPDTAALYVGDALNKRLNTTGLNATGILLEIEKRGTTFMDVVIEPELDSYRYNGVRSMVCDVFVLETLRAAGVFGSVGDKIQMTELTPKDLYRLSIYNDSWHMPSTCTQAGPPAVQGACQLIGSYELDLPGFNTIKPFKNMCETCASDPAPKC